MPALPEVPDVRDVAELVAAAAAERPDEPAVVEAGGRTLTWAGLDDEVGRVATGLGAAGIVAGRRVMVVATNRLELVTSYLGVLRAQAVAVPVNPGSTPGELARLVADSGSRLVVADAGSVGRVREGLALLRQAVADRAEGRPTDLPDDLVARAPQPSLVVVGAEPEAGDRSYDDLVAAAGRPVPPLQDPDKLACLLYTSGTSGRPRAAMLSHRALLANVDQVARVDPPMIRGEDVVLGVLPLFHVYGLNAVLGGVLRHRARLVLVERFHPESTLDVVEEHGCTVVPAAPAVFPHWRDVDRLRERLASVRLVLSGSAPLAPEVVEDFTARTGVPVHQGYGLTEAAPVVTSTLCSTDPAPASVGAALPGIDVRLVDDAGREPEPGDPGEIQVRGANLFSGYWPDGADGPDADGWWSTGDVGFLDPTGDLFLVDRVREIVIVSGFNVFPVEVEQVVREVEGVRAVAVIGVPDESTGEAVVAYVVPADGADRDALADAVTARCAERLAGFKRPSRVRVVAELPLTITGKVQKGRLRGIERRRALGLLEDA